MAQITLRPNGTGAFNGQLVPVGAATMWETVDETSSDGDTTYSVTVVGGETGSTTLPAHGLSGVIINSCTFYGTARNTLGADDVLIGGSNSAGADCGLINATITDTYAEYSQTFTTNPNTGSAYTLTDLSNLQLTFLGFGGSSRITQLYVIVDYSTYTPPEHNCILIAGN